MCQSVNLFVKQQFIMLVVVLPIFVTDTKIIFGYNFVALLRKKAGYIHMFCFGIIEISNF